MAVTYSPKSIVAYLCGSATYAALSSNPITAGSAESAKEMVASLFDGVEIAEGENNMQATLLQAIDKAWKAIQQKYDLTDSCMKDLNNEVMGSGTSVDSFMRNSESRGLNDAIAIVINSILLKHVDEFNRNARHTWTVAYTENASKDIANILIDSVNGVFKTNDSLLLLKAIRDSDAKRHQEHQEITKKLDQIQDGLENVSKKKSDIPQCLTPIPTVNHEVGLVGRDDIKRKVQDMLEENDRTALVNGLGGIGKTAVMLHVCNDLKNEGKYVAWIECGDSLKEDLLLLRTALGISDSDDADTAYEKIINELKTDSQLAENVYLFMDNLSRILSEEEQKILNSLKVHVMATSRFDHDYFAILPLDSLVEESALDMFYSYYLEKYKDKTRRYKDAALDIIRSVQCHTLLVELLAKAAWKKGGTLEAFRDALKADGVFEVFKRKLSTKHDKNRTIEECVMELYKISRLTPAQQHIMRLFTIFTPEKEIYYEILHWADLDEDAMDELVDLGWLERGGLENGYKIHQIVKESLIRQMKKDGENIKLEDYGEFLSKVIDTNIYLGIDVPYEIVRERLTLVEDIVNFFKKDDRKDAAAGALFNNIAWFYINQNEYKKALGYCTDALAINERVFGLEHPAMISTYNHIATVSVGLGDYVNALEYCEKALVIYKRSLESEHPHIITTFNIIASIYDAQNDFEKALEFLGKARTFSERILGPEHPCTAATYNNIGAVYNGQGNFETALKFYRKAHSINVQELGLDHPDTAITYNNMAGEYYEQGNFEKALEFLKRACVIDEQVLKSEHPHMAITYYNIAAVHDAQGDYEKALKFLEKELAINVRVLGSEHPDTATTYYNMAGEYYKMANFEAALEYCKKALAIRNQVLGSEHPDTATTYNNIALIYRQQGDFETALKYYGKALVIRERILGSSHPDTMTTYSNIAWVNDELGNYETTLEYYGKALTNQERILGLEHPDTASTYNNIASVYYKQGNFETSLEYYEKALDIRERVLGSEHPDTAKSYYNMALVYKNQGEYDKALDYYQKAFKVFLSVFGEEHPFTTITHEHLAELRDKTNQ